MRALIDTPIWSLAMRRRRTELSPKDRRLVAAWSRLIADNLIILPGPIRQEILSGVRDEAVFDRLCEYLRAFDDEPLTADDYEEAARCSNTCRAAGVSGSSVDFLLCAAAIRRGAVIFTTDKDFSHYARVLPLKLFGGD